MFEFYEVGGKIRDELLGLKSKDVDYVAVPSSDLIKKFGEASDMFKILHDFLISEGFTVFLVTPEFFTIRAMFPKKHKYKGVADFVMSRKEIGYVAGTRNPIVIPGTLYDDLERRDFTVNAIAKDGENNLIDYFNGIKDLKLGVLKTPLPCEITFNDDPLRILRCCRFSITKGFTINDDIIDTIKNYDYDSKMSIISESRIRDEIFKCFNFNTLKTLSFFKDFSKLENFIFSKTNIWLKPTNEKK